MTNKLMKNELSIIKIPRGLRKRIASIMGISEVSVSNIANCHTKSYLKREQLKKAIITALHEEVDKIGK